MMTLSPGEKMVIYEQRMREIRQAQAALDQEFSDVYQQWLDVWLLGNTLNGMGRKKNES